MSITEIRDRLHHDLFLHYCPWDAVLFINFFFLFLCILPMTSTYEEWNERVCPNQCALLCACL